MAEDQNGTLQQVQQIAGNVTRLVAEDREYRETLGVHKDAPVFISGFLAGAASTIPDDDGPQAA